MYNDYFGFKEAPFSIAPDPRYLFMTPQHREALAHLVYGLNSEGGCLLLTGEVGTGKTTVCRCLLNQIPDNANIALVLNPKVTANELLATICDELKIAHDDSDTIKTHVDLINSHLIESHGRGEKNVLIIDEAQNLDKPVLEQLRLLTNLETDKQKLLQIIILGQPELIDILSTDEMRQLAQRITARFHLKPLSREDIKAYINHRLAVAGQNVQLFPEPTIKKLYQLSKGIPRLINILCDRALLGAYVQNKYSVDNATMEQAAKEVFGEIKNVTHKKQGSFSWPVFAGVTATLVIGALAFALYRSSMQNTVERTAPRPATQLQQLVETTAEDSTPEPVPVPAIHPVVTAQNTTSPAEPVSSDEIARYIDTSNSDNKAAAYASLFRLWDHEYDENRHLSACKHARLFGLSCLHKQGNLTSMRRLNRPAVVKLYNTDGRSAYALVTRLDEETVTLIADDRQLDIEAAQLDKHWLGEFTVLWKNPPFYVKALAPGSNGPMVQWLDQQMVRLYGYNDTPTIHDTYDEELIDQVKKFQLSKGLVPDGVAGPLTFIHLNTELGETTPVLTTTSDTTRES